MQGNKTCILGTLITCLIELLGILQAETNKILLSSTLKDTGIHDVNEMELIIFTIIKNCLCPIKLLSLLKVALAI